MKFAILSYEYPPETGFGGIGTYSYYQARALAKLGHDVHVFAGSTTKGTTHTEHEGVRVTRIKQDGWFQRLTKALGDRRCWWTKNRLETAYAAYCSIRRALDRGETFDFLEMPECGGDGAITNTLLPIPTAVRFHSPARLIMGIYDTPRMDRELTAWVEQVAIQTASVRTSCSQFLADEVRARMGVAAPVHVIPNGIDLALFDRDEGIDVHERFGIPRDGVKVFFANRMEERKGIHLVREMALHVLKQHPHVHMVFAGNDLFGFMEKRILPEIRAAGLGKRFHYVGQRTLPEVRAILKHVDVFLIPSLWENAPYSCLEAMSAGRAIVSSDCGGMPELIRDRETGLLARNNDGPSFVRALDEAVSDAALRDRMGRAARAEVEARLTDVVVAQRSVEVYRGWLDANVRRA
jgi:glycogen(starch) synthase